MWDALVLRDPPDQRAHKVSWVLPVPKGKLALREIRDQLGLPDLREVQHPMTSYRLLRRRWID